MAGFTKHSLTLAGLGMVAGLVSFAEAPVQAFEFGIYELENHPDGSAASPYYGLRLDGLLTGNAGDIYTFDFEHPDSDVQLAYDGSTIEISGWVFGGLDAGSEYVATESGLWEIDFVYDTIVDNGDRLVVVEETGSGTIESLDFAADRGAFNLEPKSNGSFAFKVEEGHRGFSGFSGWGWLTHEPTDGGSGGELGTYLNASDWLFTVGDRIGDINDDIIDAPEPSAVLTSLAIGLGVIWKRRRGSKQ